MLAGLTLPLQWKPKASARSAVERPRAATCPGPVIADLQALRTTLRTARAMAGQAADRGERLVCQIIESVPTGS
ncbi:hypothetical protein [Streptomyces sp. NPDC048269]|uniref:hypothetical protein n=1 Tax=Streptomyces sp. NPDC048269 TaxID=3155753 RepID=UPI0034276360